MFDRLDYQTQPDVIEIGEYVRNPLWLEFCGYMMEIYKIQPTYDFSKCSWEYGWNVKFKKGNKTLCTLYPYENYFIVMIVIGKKEKEAFDAVVLTLSSSVQQIVEETQEGNGQKWLMIPCEDDDQTMNDVKSLIAIRAKK